MNLASEASALHLFLDRHLESGRGNAIAIRTPDASYSYSDLEALVNRAGNLLRGLGVRPEQRVALLLPDGIELVATFFGAIKIGAVAVPLNTRLTAGDYRVMLRDSRARVLVAEASFAPLVDDLAGQVHWLTSVLMVGQPPSNRYPRFHDLLKDAQPRLEPTPLTQDDMAFWLYTSGTTGLPKAAVHPRRTLQACRYYGSDVLGVSEQDRIFATSKLFFAYALGNALLIPLFARAQTYLHPAWADPALVAGVLRDFQPTLFFSVPTLYARLLRADLPPATFRSVRLCVSAGERLPAELYTAWEQRFGVPILDGIGATETVFMFLSNRPDQRRAGSSGLPVPGTEARILDAEGREVPTGEQGVLWIKTPSAAAGYWNRLDLTRQTFVGEWYRTRDAYVRDADGFYYHRGREDDWFKVAAMWVNPVDVEQRCLDHPGVLEAGVVGAEDEGGLVKPFLFVVPRDPTAEAEPLVRELEAWLGQRLASHQRPQRIVVVPELPHTATGKLQRFKLGEQVRRLLQPRPESSALPTGDGEPG